MRSSSFLSLAVILVLLAVAAMEAGAIRLDVQTRASVVRSNQILATNVKPSDDATVKGSTAAASSAVAVGENTKRNAAAAAAAATVAAEEVRAVAHKLPEFHEDYYGPSDHSPRHH